MDKIPSPLPPKKLYVYKNDVCVERFKPSSRSKPPGGARGDVLQWSAASRKRLAFVANNTRAKLDTMITLTYPAKFEQDGSEVKRHLHNALKWLRRRIQPLTYLWFLEFQRRGAPHIHVLIDRRGVYLPHEEVAAAWYRIVDSGDDKHLAAGTRTEAVKSAGGAARYALKYAVKMEQKVVPENYRNVGRLWGHSRDVKPEPERVLEIDGIDEFNHLLQDWEYLNKYSWQWGTLFNAASHLD